jgi:ATP-dependent DNA helicase DinG
MSLLQKDLDKYFPRKEQVDCINFINAEWNKNKDSKIFLLNLPVGSGKSHLALMIADWYRKNVSKGSRIDIITNSKILQDQYSQTYNSINDLKGKENYECSQYATSCAEGNEFCRLNKTKCESCPHLTAKDGYFNGNISLTNFYLYILYSLYMPKMMEMRDSKVLIVDEAHSFDDVMSDFISIKITENVIKRLKFSNEKTIITKLKKVKTIVQYIEFIEELQGEVEQTICDIERALAFEKRSVKSDRRENKISKLLNQKNSDSKMMSIISDLKTYQSKIEVFLKEYKANPDNWVLESSWNEKTKQNELSLEPIWAFDYLDKYVFSKYDMVFLMSGTILNKSLFCHLNGLDEDKSVYYSIDSPFDIKNRPIYYMPLGKMSYTKKEETFKNYVPYINKILSKYSDKKGMIHTNSFELASWISKDINNQRLVYHDSSNKDEVLKSHIETDNPTVIVSPSMSTGVSLDDDSARFQIIAKVPYPSLASQKNKLRQKMNPDWYSYVTVSGIIQMSGRVVRSSKDWGDTIILDGSFGDLIKYSGHLFPNWFKNSIKRVNVKVAN